MVLHTYFRESFIEPNVADSGDNLLNISEKRKLQPEAGATIFGYQVKNPSQFELNF